jgi:hypothetical protein
MQRRTRSERSAYRILIGNPEGKGPFGRLGIGGKIILKWIIRK